MPNYLVFNLVGVPNIPPAVALVAVGLGLLGIAAVGNDVQILGSKQTGSILVDRMTVAGE